MYNKYVKPNCIIVNLGCGIISEPSVGSLHNDEFDVQGYRNNVSMWDEDEEDEIGNRTIFDD